MAHAYDHSQSLCDNVIAVTGKQHADFVRKVANYIKTNQRGFPVSDEDRQIAYWCQNIDFIGGIKVSLVYSPSKRSKFTTSDWVVFTTDMGERIARHYNG